MATAFKEERFDGLARLNETERRVLLMLAEGHTAKSIAHELGMSTAAVNERLREARRKTGLGSSREVARLLRSQETRHDQLRVVTSAPPVAAFDLQDAEPWRPQIGVIAMIAAFLTAAAGAAILMTQKPPSDEKDDPLFAAILAQQVSPALIASQAHSREEADRLVAGTGFKEILRQLHAQVHSEARDATWAGNSEDALRGAFAAIPGIGAQGTELRVLCASTLCEIAGTVETPADPSKGALERFNRQTMSRLNPQALKPVSDRLGLETMWADISAYTQTPPRLSYVFYYRRKG